MLPSLARLTAPTRVPGNSAGSMEQSSPLEESSPLAKLPLDMLIKVLVNEGNAEQTCKMVFKWCMTHTKACGDEVWQAAIRVFGVTPQNKGDIFDEDLSWRAAFARLCTQLFQLPTELRGALLLDADPMELNGTGEDGNTALIVASRQNSIELVRLLLRRGANVQARGHRQYTALLMASKSGHVDIVRLLLDNGAEVTEETKHGANVLILASWMGHIDVVNALIARPDIDVNKNDSPGRTALMAACMKGHADVVIALLAHPDIRINQTDGARKTALHFASEAGHLVIVRLLLARDDIELEIGQWQGYTALDFAKRKHHADVEKVLREAENFVCAAKYGDLDVVRAGIAAGLNLNMRYFMGTTALMWASAEGHTAIVRALLDNGANVNLRDNDDRTALAIATARHDDIVTMLHEAGATG